ncbi:MAG: hypothetical protein A2X46_13750 [Lentisphaerae bacterium GWF2_57_35]|nr:MAG: hypothetical protein A2X46_13750 [Lentisphaerae bacterium GWF2_57_35]
MARPKKEKSGPITVEKYLKGMDYPAGKEDLIEHAEDLEAPDEVISILNQLPDESYETAADVTKAIGEIQ